MLVRLVYLVYLVCLVCLVCLVFWLNETNQMNQRDPSRMSRASRARVCGADRSQYMQGRSVAISNNLTRPDTPLEAAVLSHDAVLKYYVGAWLIHRLAHCARHRFPILPVHERQPVVLRARPRLVR